MRLPEKLFASIAVAAACIAPALAYDFGRRATPDEIRLWDIDVRPDGKGLPEGRGTVARGKQVFEENCAAYHGDGGQGGIKDRLVGGQGTLASDMPVKTVGSFWPYATTLFDYTRRGRCRQTSSRWMPILWRTWPLCAVSGEERRDGPL
jgi:cytochrome c